MKKHILFLIFLLFLNTVYSQVLYDDNFDNYTLGNLGTDPNGVTPGQGGWLTKDGGKNNSCFTITAETGRGKVLTLSTIDTISQHTPILEALRPGLNTLVDQRIPINNVIKLEIDYYTGSQHPKSNNANNLINLIGEDGNSLVYWRLPSSDGRASVSILNSNNSNYLRIDNGTSNAINPLPFNTWVTFIVYLDYNNKKVYFETPYFGTVVAGDFLDQSNSTNLIEDFKPSKIRLYIINQAANILKHQMVNKYDNIKITALKAVPPEVIALSVNSFLSEKFNLYPNPATDIVNITNSENMLVEQVAVYDVTGKQLSTQTFTNEAEIKLNVQNLASGVYLLHIKTNQGTAVKKVVKK